MNKTVGNRLKKLRQSKIWSQEQVADYLHISQSAYARIERGESSSWATYIKKICEIYNIGPEELFKEEQEIESKENDILQVENQLPEKLGDKLVSQIKDLKKIIKFLKQNKDLE